MTKEELISYITEEYNRVNTVLEIIKNYYSEDLVEVIFPFKDCNLDLIINHILNILPEYHNINTNKLDLDIHNLFIFTIIIKFPELKITNEVGESITVFDFFVKFDINMSKCRMLGDFRVIKSMYSEHEYEGRYVHSHAPALANFPAWTVMCFGNATINKTLDALQGRISSNLSIETLWEIFCIELREYLSVESLQGGPYIKIREVGSTTSKSISYSPVFIMQKTPIIYHFINQCINKIDIKLSYNGNRYILGEDYYKFYIKLSNIFIEWVNRKYKTLTSSIKYLIGNYTYRDGVLYKYVNSTSVNPQREGERVLTFKGNDIPLKIIRNTSNSNELTLLKPMIVNWILTLILSIANNDTNEGTIIL